MATTKATTLAHTLGGISSDISTAEINRLDGVTGDIQTLLNLKAPLASPTFTGTITAPNDSISGDAVSGGTIGAGTLGSSVVFPAGHVIKTHMNEGDTTDVIINNTTDIGDISVTYDRIKGNSNFLITIAAMMYRPSTAAAVLLGYRISVNSSVVATVERMVKDDNSWHTQTAIFWNTTTGSAGDTVKFEILYKNSASVDNNFRLPVIVVHEIAV